MKKLRLGEAFTRLDVILVARVFMPISEKIDHKLGINPYRLAIYFLIASVACGFFIFADGQHHWWLLYGCFGLAFPVFRYVEIKRLEKVSAAYERFLMTPSESFKIPIEWAYFVLPFQRLANLVMYFIVMPADIILALGMKSGLAAAAYLINDQWIILLSIGLYFGGCLPPGRGRKEKKRAEAKDWTFGLMPKKVRT